jgi:hypothetical protein
MNENMGTAAPQESKGCGTQGCLCGGRGPMASQMLRMMMPSDAAGSHFRTAGIEFLKGFRELLDHQIQAMSHEHQSRGTKLNVD